MTAVGKGFDAYVAVDASGTFSETKRQVGLLRMLQAGVIVSDYTTLMVEILKDKCATRSGEFTGPWTWLGPSLSARSPTLSKSKRPRKSHSAPQRSKAIFALPTITALQRRRA